MARLRPRRSNADLEVVSDEELADDLGEARAHTDDRDVVGDADEAFPRTRGRRARPTTPTRPRATRRNPDEVAVPRSRRVIVADDQDVDDDLDEYADGYADDAADGLDEVDLDDDGDDRHDRYDEDDEPEEDVRPARSSRNRGAVPARRSPSSRPSRSPSRPSSRSEVARPAPARKGRVAAIEEIEDDGLGNPNDPTDDTLRKALAPGYVVGTALTLVSVILLMFVADLLVVGHIRHARDQVTAFADLRADLANGTAPVNQTDENFKFWPLGTPLGVLEIPQIGLREVYFEGTTSGVLMSGPGHRRDTPMPGQAGTSVIMGRKAGFGGPFTYLSELQPAMVLRVITGQGTAAYRVTNVRKAGDPLPANLVAGQGRLTLITAEGTDYMPSDAVYVDAQLVGVYIDGKLAGATMPAGPRPMGPLDLPINERQMHGDPSAWIGVVTWAALLAGLAAATMWVRMRWGKWQTWVAAAPPLLAVGLQVSEQLIRLMPNVL